MPSDQRFDLAESLFRISPSDGIVDTMCRMIEKLFCKDAMCLFVPCNDDETGNIFIQPVNDTGTIGIFRSFREIIYMVKQDIDESPRIRCKRRMHDHAGRF